MVTTFYTLDGMKSILLLKFVFFRSRLRLSLKNTNLLFYCFYYLFYKCCTSYYNIPSSLPEGAFRKLLPTKNTTKENPLVVFVFSPLKLQRRCVPFFIVLVGQNCNSFLVRFWLRQSDVVPFFSKVWHCIVMFAHFAAMRGILYFILSYQSLFGAFPQRWHPLPVQ